MRQAKSLMTGQKNLRRVLACQNQEDVYKRQVLKEKYRTLKTQGNFNNELGLPLTVFRLRDEDEIAVLEMGISDFGEMTRLAKIAKPETCVITNIGTCHLEKMCIRDRSSSIGRWIHNNGIVMVSSSDFTFYKFYTVIYDPADRGIFQTGGNLSLIHI